MTGRLRVLVIEPQSNPGGFWHYACCQARGLVEAGCDVALATVFPYEELAESTGLRIWKIGAQAPRAPFLPASWLFRAAKQCDSFLRLCRMMREFQPDVVHLHNHMGKLDFLYLAFVKALGVPLVYTAHEPRHDTGAGARWFGWARYRLADAVLVHSVNAAQDLVSAGVDGTRIARIEHGNYLQYCQTVHIPADDAKRLVGTPARARTILFFGTVAPYKGLDVLIAAFWKLIAESLDAYLVVAGEPLEDFTPYRRQIDALQLGDRVILDLRYVPFDECPKYFYAADVVAFPYRRIYQSGVLHLAYGYGRPVVVTNVGGVAEAVADDQTGLVVPPEDPDALASALRRMLSDPVSADEMGRRGRRLAETKYSWDAIARRVIEVYRSVCADVDCRRGRPCDVKINGQRGRASSPENEVELLLPSERRGTLNKRSGHAEDDLQRAPGISGRMWL